jgi:ppGpp synthetase/RelA/SpoT-type nucleotidyltranferase
MADLIDEFIERYVKEYDFYDQAGRLAAQKLETTLQSAGIRSIVTNRAKSISRLREKCLQREKLNGSYTSVNAIFDDVVDLTGVRIALYFPAEREQVDGMIKRIFQVHRVKEFPDKGKVISGKRFTGYSAVHYRVQLNEQALGEPDKRYARAKIEIQVASILMHAWSEVEHDLIYKPLAGSLSGDEYAILDQLNGLVISGEIALEMLQRAGEARVAGSGKRFLNHYDLASHLIHTSTTKIEKPIGEAGLGRVDLLFELLARLELDTPECLLPYMEALHGNLEIRPLAEQIIDALLAEDSTRYNIYREIQEERNLTNSGDHPGDEERYRQLGLFMDRWIEVERLIHQIAITRGDNARYAQPISQARRLDLLPQEAMAEFDYLRRMRNVLVHGVEPVASTDLADASQRLEVIRAEIERRSS